MSLSRSESRYNEKLKRKKRFRKRMTYNLVIGCAVLLLAVFALSLSKENKWTDWFQQMGDKLGIGSTSAPADHKDGQDKPAGNGNEGDGNVLVGEHDPEKPSDDPVSDGDGDAGGPDAAAGSEDGADTEGGGTISAPDTAERISLSFVGDLLLGDYVQPFVNKFGYEYLYEQALFYLSEPDLTAGNLELPITKRGVPESRTPLDSGYVYKGSPDVLPALRDAGFDVVSLANNHALDQGVEGLRDTMAHLEEAGIEYMGAGNNDKEAFTPVIKEVKGMKVAFIGISRVIPFADWKADRNVAGVAESYDTTRAAAAIAEAKEQADIVVVMVHWGKERTTVLQPHQKDFGKVYIDAGADLVIGSHPHVLQGFENYKGKWIAYSLGNFIFSSYPKDAEAETGVLDAVCTKSGDCDLKFHPMAVKNAQPAPLSGEASKALLDRLTSISIGVRLEADGSLTAK